VRGSEVWILYIRGVERLGEKIKHKHFYLSTRVPFHCEITPSIRVRSLSWSVGFDQWGSISI
jgi:hypothetical protein